MLFHWTPPTAYRRPHSLLRDLCGTAALEVLVFELFCVGWFALFRWELQPTWPDLFPIAPEYNVILFLLAFGIVSLYCRHQYELHGDIYTKCINLMPDLRNSHSELLEALINELDCKALGQLEKAGLACKKPIGIKMLEISVCLSRLRERGLERLAQGTLYVWAFTVPWLLWGGYDWYGLIVLPIIALPLFCLRQYGVLFRHDHWTPVNPNWSQLRHYFAAINKP
jgi:hypothetical protein